jgi:biopolymer transport protein TolR
MASGARRRKLMGEINVVPYIDVMLVLLIIFMVTAPLLTQGVKVELPKAAANTISDAKREPLVISVDRGGRYYVNVGGKADQAVASTELARRVGAVLARDAETPVLLKADQAVPYGKVVTVLVLLNEAGAPRVGFVTEPGGGDADARRR